MTSEDGNYEGFIIDMLDELDIGYKIVSPEDRRYGALNENTGKWSGMMGMIIDNVSLLEIVLIIFLYIFFFIFRKLISLRLI